MDRAQIPWKGCRFDADAQTTAVATHALARATIEQMQSKGGSRSIGFCVSQRHADFMARLCVGKGLRAASVHAAR
ncbi:MAG: hypothetical protein ACJAW4_003667 [Paracoccaceae bacterium]